MGLQEDLVNMQISGKIETAILKVVAEMGVKNPVGEVKIYAGATPPENWGKCEGQILSISEYPELFSVLGIAHGGDGITSFKLPDFRGRVVLGVGAGTGLTPRNIGELGGVEEVTLLEAQIPAHNHAVRAQSGLGDTNVPVGNIWADTGAFDNEYSTLGDNVNMFEGAISSTGAGESHANIQPFIALNYIIYLGE